MYSYTLEFREEDLAANRRGELTDRQRKHLDTDLDLLRKQIRLRTWALAGAAVMVAFILAGIFITSAAPVPLSTALILCGSMAGMYVVILIVVLVIPFRKIGRLSRGEVLAIEGDAHIVTSMRLHYGPVDVNGVAIRHNMDSNMSFYFGSRDSLRHFQEGHVYRVYYLLYSPPRAISVEEIGMHANSG